MSFARLDFISVDHGYVTPVGFAGAGVTGAGAGQYFFTRGTPAPVSAGLRVWPSR